nr:SEC-C metal-binding domain-containing protein [Halobacillus alkaliphilus]
MNVSYASLKENIRKHDLTNSVQQLLLLYIEDGNSFIRNLLLSGSIIEPITLGVKEKDIQFVNQVFFKAFRLIEEKIVDEEKDFEEFTRESSRLLHSINIIYNAFKENAKLLYQNEFLGYPFKKQIQMYCTFIESQSIYAQRNLENTMSQNKYFTGMEEIVTQEGKSISINDNFEAIIELFDTLIRLLQYKSKGKIDGQSNKSYTNVSPYFIPSIQQIMHLTSHKETLDVLWERIKYRGWQSKVYKTEDNNIYYYAPNNQKILKLERAATLRYKYKEYVDYVSNIDLKSAKELLNDINKNIKFSLHKPEELFALEPKILTLCLKLSEPRIETSIEKMKDKLGNRFSTIKIGVSKTVSLFELYDSFSYLLSLGTAYSVNSTRSFNDTDFSYLTPVFDIDYFVKGLSQYYSLDMKKAREVIELFVFKPKDMKESLDVFSQPLIYVGDNQVVFCPHLIQQMNLERIVEKHLNSFNVQLSAKGTLLENKLTSTLDFSPYFEVNHTKVKFKAYDHKQVEYDMIGVMDNKILLIEMKCLTRPYSDFELYQKEKEILFGVEQVNRRENILIKQPELVQNHMDISLPTNSPTKEDIIKIVCTDIYDFTGRTEGDVYITDTSAFMKFFLDPEIEQVEIQDGQPSVTNVKSLFEEKPNSKVLIEYLKLPPAVKPYFSNLVEEPRQLILLNEESDRIAFKDFILRNNPYEPISKTSSSRKIGRNEKCPCDSGKKYKKCCGK